MIKGGPSLNPSGRRKGQAAAAAALSDYILDQTDGGRELVDRLLVLLRGDGSARERKDAAMVLLDRAVGRAHGTSELTVISESASDSPVPEDFDTWTPEAKHSWIAERSAKQRGLS